MSALEIKKSIYWVGVVNWSLRDFHGYSLARKGTTYSDFLVKDEKTTLIDTVDNRYFESFLHNIESVSEVVGSLKVKNTPTEAALLQCIELGKSVGQAVQGHLGVSG